MFKYINMLKNFWKDTQKIIISGHFIEDIKARDFTLYFTYFCFV